MIKFSEILAALSSPFKTLPQATAAIEPVKATLDSVNALFVAAGLPLEQMLATGPDSLKAHLASIDKSADVTRLQTELSTKISDFTAQLAAKDAAHASAISAKIAELSAATASLTAATGFLAAIGFDATAKDKDGKPLPADSIKPLWAAHVKKATNLEMANLGVPARYIPKEISAGSATPTDAALAKEYESLPRGEAKRAFYAKHEQALWRHEKTLNNRDE